MVIIGKKGWFYELIFKLVEELYLERSVVFIGFVIIKEKFILLLGVYFFIYLLIYEGFGLLVLEVIIYGIFIIISKLLLLFEVVGNVVFYINFYDV